MWVPGAAVSLLATVLLLPFKPQQPRFGPLVQRIFVIMPLHIYAGLKGMGYWSIPLLLQLKPVNFIRIGLGPQWNFQSNRDKYKLQNGQNAFKNYVSLALDAQLKLSSKTRIYFRYNKGLQSFENLTIRDAPRMNRLEFGLMQSLILN